MALGLKGLRWRSVEQPRIAPKPQLIPLTGGYRRIPVLQIGADIYCDTRCILAELERRYPAPSLYPPGSRGMADMIAAWADQALFANALGLVFAINGDRFPPELHADRAVFTAGKFDGWDSVKMRAQLPSLRDQFEIYLSWLDDRLAGGQQFLLGNAPSLADLAVYHPLWYVGANLGDSGLLQGHSRLRAWMDRIAAIGHGHAEDMLPSNALAIARDATPASVPTGDEAAEICWRPGECLQVVPTDWGFDAVAATFVSATKIDISLRRTDPEIGETVVHFPRSGFAITRL